METERELFEDFCFESGLVTNKDFFKNRGWCDVVAGAWVAWQASANREGFVLVPTDLVGRCISHITVAECHPHTKGDEITQMNVDMGLLEVALNGDINENQD